LDQLSFCHVRQKKDAACAGSYVQLLFALVSGGILLDTFKILSGIQ